MDAFELERGHLGRPAGETPAPRFRGGHLFQKIRLTVHELFFAIFPGEAAHP